MVKTSDDIFIEELQKAKQNEELASTVGKKNESVKGKGKNVVEENVNANKINKINNKGTDHIDDGNTNTKTDKTKSKIVAVYMYSKEEAARIAKGEVFKRADEIRSGKLQKPIIYNKNGKQVGGGGIYNENTVTTTGVGVSMKTGKVYYGDSGMNGNLTRSKLTDSKLEKIVETEKTKLLKQNGKEYYDANNKGIISNEKWNIENCAEFNIANQALKNGENLNDLVVYTVNTKSGNYKPPCDNCKNIFNDMNFIK